MYPSYATVERINAACLPPTAGWTETVHAGAAQRLRRNPGRPAVPARQNTLIQVWVLSVTALAGRRRAG